MVKDFDLVCGQHPRLLKDEVTLLVKYINSEREYGIKTGKAQITDLNYEGFIDFIV